MDNKYKEGDIVHSIVNPDQKLLVRRYLGRIYYCTIKDHPERTELVYFERELADDLVRN
jgi:hypothetical protein